MRSAEKSFADTWIEHSPFSFGELLCFYSLDGSATKNGRYIASSWLLARSALGQKQILMALQPVFTKAIVYSAASKLPSDVANSYGSIAGLTAGCVRF